MFYVLSKVLDLLLSPLVWAMILVAAGLVTLPGGDARFPRWYRRRRFAPAAGLGVLYLASTQAVALSVTRAVEGDAPATFRPEAHYDAVVLLGGVVNEEAMALSRQPSYNDNVERLLTTYDLLRRGQADVAVIAGGTWNPIPGQATEAHLLGRQLTDWGIDPTRIVLEDRSVNTHENAAFTAPLLRARGATQVVLVTSAFHMNRSLACFRAENVAVDTYPVDFRAGRLHWTHQMFLPRADHLADTCAALRELAGRAVYRLRGFGRGGTAEATRRSTDAVARTGSAPNTAP